MPRQIVPVSDVASILLTQDEGDLRYLPITYAPPPVDLSVYYTKVQSDARYEPLDSAYTKAESDAKYLTQALGDVRYQPVGSYALTSHLHTGVYQPVGSYALTSHNHDAAYSPVAHLHTGTYLPLTGGTLTGELIANPATGYAVTVQAGGLRVHGSALGYTGEITYHNTAAAGLYGLATLASGTPRMLFDHRATSNTGDWVWRNGTGAGAVKMLLSGVGALTTYPDAESAGLQTSPAYGNQTWLSSARSDGRLVLNTGATGLHQWAFGPWLAGTVKMSLDPSGRLTLGSARSDQPAVFFGESTMSIKNDGVFGLMEIAAPAYGIDTYVAGVRTYMIRTDAITPMPDNTRYCGTGANRWIAVYAVAGSINTSHAEAKKNFKPLDPVACTAAVLETDWLSYEYLPPPPPERKEGESNSDRLKTLDGYLATQAETAHVRKQNGYVLGHPTHKTHDLFGLADRQSASPSADLGILACALQSALQRIAALEGKPV